MTNHDQDKTTIQDGAPEIEFESKENLEQSVEDSVEQNHAGEVTKDTVLTDIVSSNEKTIETKQRAQLKADYRLGHDKELIEKFNLPTIHLPSDYLSNINASLEKLPEGIRLGDSEGVRRWADVLENANYKSNLMDVLARRANDESALFVNEVSHEGKQLNGAAPRLPLAENTRLDGDRALFRVLNSLEVGTLFNCPLWHSGIWVTFRPPSDTAILSLNQAIQQEKINLGRYTYGLLYSNTSSYITDLLVDFAIEHVYNITATNESGITQRNLKDHILSPDIPLLLWGLACSMYPNGFRYERACAADASKCNHVEEERLNLIKLLFVDYNSLDSHQLSHMSHRRQKSRDLKHIQEYRERSTNLNSHRFVYTTRNGSEIAFTFKVPTISEYVDHGHEWIGGIVELVDRVLKTEVNDTVRNRIIRDYASASIMRQYGHWVEKIEIDTAEIVDRTSIKENLDLLSSDLGVRTAFTEEIIKYIDKSTIAIIGIPQYECPSCQEPQPEFKLDAFKNLIPINVLGTFFDLLTQRVLMVRVR